jgi:hypothetical protein
MALISVQKYFRQSFKIVENSLGNSRYIWYPIRSDRDDSNQRKGQNHEHEQSSADRTSQRIASQTSKPDSGLPMLLSTYGSCFI